VALTVASLTSAIADVRLPRVFSNHMVLQQGRKLPVWGWADAGERVTVQLSGQPTVTTEANAKGEWRVDLPPQKAGGPLTLRISGKNVIVIEDVLVGEVWLCSGQSNMQWAVRQAKNPKEEIAAANWPLIRHFAVPRRPSTVPKDDVDASWTVCSSNTVAAYTACGYFFGRELHRELNVPIGLINSSWGGTLVEPWTPPDGFAAVPAVRSIYEEVCLKDPTNPLYQKKVGGFLDATEAWIKRSRANLSAAKPLEKQPAFPGGLEPYTSHQSPCMLYNGMIHGLVPYAIRGAIWYQGESNHRDGMLYYEKKKALIGGWRKRWQQGDFPFLFVQIAPFHYRNEDPHILPRFWEAQTATLAIPNTGMAVIHDVGNIKDIHPKNKQEVGRRLALQALTMSYGRTGLVDRGPTFKKMDVEEGQLRVHFDHVGSGLASRDGKPLDWFEVIGTNLAYVAAEAQIDGDTVVLTSKDVPQPVAMRFAWHRHAEPNLMNKEGLPAGSFRAGKVPKTDLLLQKVPEAKGYKLVYELDLGKLGSQIVYEIDNSADIRPFDRVAYFLELKKGDALPQYLYVSMDAFADDARHLGVPTAASKIRHQRRVKDLNVVSNVDGIKTGAGLPNGNIEFWPDNYGPQNGAKVPGASAAIYDFGDQCGEPVDGYGCMQVHNTDAKQTLFAVNQWKSGAHADIGIGNSGGKTRDWTFTRNASSYSHKRLRVLVREN